jgi:hypothetical protein
MQASSAAVALDLHAVPDKPQHPYARSKLTNGSRLLLGIDGRSSYARRYRDLIGELTREFGGKAVLTLSDYALIRQASSLMLRCEQMQACVVRDEPVNEDRLIRLSSEARRILLAVKRKVVERKRASPAAADYQHPTP